MESCSAVEKEVDKVLNRFRNAQNQTSDYTQEIIDQLTTIQKELLEYNVDTDVNTAHSLLATAWAKKTKDNLAKISSEHKELHGSVSKVGKSIDRNFISDFSSVIADDALQGENSVQDINRVICEHFLRHGMLDIAQCLIQDSSLSDAEVEREPFLELHCILEALKRKDLRPALQWVEENREKLEQQNSSLEFRLHRLQFVELVRQGQPRQQEALQYARKFAMFAHTHQKEVQVLMGTLLYLRTGLELSPYAHLLDPIQWAEMCDLFTRDACTLLGLSVESPLSVVIRAGCAALPPLLNIKQVMQQHHSAACAGVWATRDELPVEVDLGSDCRFHSLFACPILRQQTTDANPPVRLVCGHVISKDALNKLASGSKSVKVKCPYCPVEQSPTDAKQIYF